MSSALRKACAVTAVVAATGAAVTVGGIRFASADTATATTGVNIRSGPGTQHNIVGGLYRGQKITAVSEPDNGWVQVRFNGSNAYVSARYLDLDGNVSGSDPVTISTSGTKVSTAALNVRGGPGLQQEVVGYFSQGQSVTLTGKQSDGWVEVLYGGERAWVSSQYLASSMTGMPGDTSSRVATADLLIRTSSNADFKIITVVQQGTELQATGTTRNGYAQVIYNDARRWVTARYLADGSGSDSSGSGGNGGSESVPDAVGTRYAQTALNIRTTWRSDDRTVDEVPTGARLKITGEERNGRAQVVYDGAARWVTAEWLSRSKPSSGGSSNDSPGSHSSRTKGEIALEYAKAQLGKPYVWAAEGPDAFDCSGLTLRAWQAAGVNLPRVTYDQVNASPRVAKSDLRPGDLVFFYGSSPSHVGIYAGNGQMIHAPRPGETVEYTSISYMPFAGATRPG